MIDVELLSRQIVRNMRGKRSQRALSRRLQYTTNVVYLWESGRRWPTVASFFWLAHRTGSDVSAALDRFVLGDPLQGIEAPWQPAFAPRLRRPPPRRPAAGRT